MMVEKPHYDLMKAIRGYCKHLNEGKISVVDFFIESSYTDEKGEERPCFLRFFSDWKSGKSKPKVDKLKKIADYFGVTIEYFLE